MGGRNWIVEDSDSSPSTCEGVLGCVRCGRSGHLDSSKKLGHGGRLNLLAVQVLALHKELVQLRFLQEESTLDTMHYYTTTTILVCTH